MRIKLTDQYSGVPSGMKTIYPGEYEAEDPRVFGLAGYLVQTGHAEEIEDIPAVSILDEKGEKLPQDAPKPLDEMSVAELKVLATSMGLDFGSRISKPELLDLIQKAAAKLDEEKPDDNPQV